MLLYISGLCEYGATRFGVCRELPENPVWHSVLLSLFSTFHPSAKTCGLWNLKRARKWWICLALDCWIFRDQWSLRTIASRSVAVNGVAGRYKSPLCNRQVTGTAVCAPASAGTHFMHRYCVLLLAVRQQSILRIVVSCKVTIDTAYCC